MFGPNLSPYIAFLSKAQISTLMDIKKAIFWLYFGPNERTGAGMFKIATYYPPNTNEFKMGTDMQV